MSDEPTKIGNWTLGRKIGDFGWREGDCPTGVGGTYFLGHNDDGSVRFGCKCVICGRCGQHTGNSMQGHYWAFCSVTRTTREFHMCCDNDCELETAGATA